MTTILNLRDSKRQEPARDKRLLIYSGSPLPPPSTPIPTYRKGQMFLFVSAQVALLGSAYRSLPDITAQQESPGTQCKVNLF